MNGGRRRLFKLHNAVGIAACGFLALIAVTGILLTFRGNFKTPRPTVAPTAQTLGIDALVAIAVREGGAPATDVALPDAPNEPFVVWLDDDDGTVMFLDGAGAVVERRKGGSGWLGLVFKLHTGELIGLPGQGLSVLAGLSLLLLSYSGVGMVLRRRR
ncbi:MAG: PepSY domain-containing protein [Nannocystaceae bacterium]